MEDEQATIESQFFSFAKLFESKTRTGETITLYNSDYWLRQANLMDDRKITMTDTGILFNKYGKSEIDINEWLVLISELCQQKQLDEEKILEILTNCGLPGETPVEIPQYRNFFLTYKSKSALEDWDASVLCGRGHDNDARKTLVRGIYTLYCRATYDGYLCWPPTPAGEIVFQNCPDKQLSNKENYAYRRCGADGFWVGRHFNDTSPNGWTNYTPCFPEVVRKLLDKVYDDEAEAQLKFQTAAITRTIEMAGIGSSFISILVSIYIFNVFYALHNRRTIIHRQLFYALLMEISVRIWLYTQQGRSMRNKDTLEVNARKGIEYLPYVCEGTYILLEYSRLAVYSWMFIEGVFLNTLISANTLRNEIPIVYFYIGGWIGPAIIIAIWASIVGQHYSLEPINTCWYGYNYLPSYYIVQGPILAIVVINMLFLGTIMTVIIMKLRRTNDSELEKIKKAIRATLILLPLLGIINIFNLIEYPLDGSSTGFAIWAYVTHFFRSFQGFFISVIYCFTNGEVVKVLKKAWERRTCCRRSERSRRASQPRERRLFAISDNQGQELIPMTVRSCNRPSSSTNDLMVPEAGPSHAELHTVSVHVPTSNRSLNQLSRNFEVNPSHIAPVHTPNRSRNQLFRNFEVYNPARRSSGPYTIPRARRQPFVRPGLVTRDTRMGNMSVSSCL